MEFKVTTRSEFETIEIAQNFESEKFPNMIICLNGELGSGKTVFTKGIANALGINESITSPTFTIIKEYDGELPLYHMDVYRLDGNIEGVGIEEYFTKGGVVVIEWADAIKKYLPTERIDIKFKILDENKRVLIMEPHGKKYEDLCEAVLWNIFLDTSNSHLIVAIYKNKTKLAYYNEKCDNNLSSQIMIIIDKIFKEAKTSPWDIDKIFVVTGPGSFTGIRIGVTIAKTFAWAFATEIVPISSLEVMATTKFKGNYIVPIIDARRNFVYAGMYDKNLNLIKPNRYINLDKLLAELNGEKVSFVTYDIIELNGNIIKPNIQILPLLKQHLNDLTVNPHQINPNYLKLTEAEENLKNA